MTPRYLLHSCQREDNNSSVTRADNKQSNLIKEDTFNVNVTNNGDIPEKYFKEGVNVFWDQILGELRQKFVDNPFSVAFEKLKKLEDHLVTSYLLEKKNPYQEMVGNHEFEHRPFRCHWLGRCLHLWCSWVTM